jgi:hypothetical protein
MEPQNELYSLDLTIEERFLLKQDQVEVVLLVASALKHMTNLICF